MSSRRKRNPNPVSTDNLLDVLSDNEITLDAGDDDSENLSLAEMTASDIADIGYNSSVGHKDDFAQMSGREKITLRSIDSIHPNRTQPRRVIPSEVRHFFQSPSADDMAHFFKSWLERIELERNGNRFPLEDYLEGDETTRTQDIEKADDELNQIGALPKMGFLESAFMKVVELAASIKRDGLTNPITVARMGRDYEIETGERRWLAYQLLNWHDPDSEWQKIPTRHVGDNVSIWRQANENNVRADLNAISMARQLALLLMDIREDDTFQPFADFGDDNEQNFYAQVADGNIYRVPRNQGEKLLNAMNLENPVQIRQYRALLRLPYEVWQWADDLNWTEGFIRMEILGKAKDDEDKIRLAYKQAKAERHTVTGDTVYEELLKSTEPKSNAQKSKYSYKHFENTLGEKVHTYIKKLSDKDREKAIDYLYGMLKDLEAKS